MKLSFRSGGHPGSRGKVAKRADASESPVLGSSSDSSCGALSRTLSLSELWLSYNRESNMIGHESTLYALKQCMCETDYQESHLSLKPQIILSLIPLSWGIYFLRMRRNIPPIRSGAMCL